MLQASGKSIDVLIAEIDANVGRAEELTGALNDQQFNWIPDPGRWSIGQAIAHLNMVNRQSLSSLEEAMEAGAAQQITGAGPFRYGFMSRKFISVMEPPVKTRVKAPAHLRPPPDVQKEKTMAEYREISTELKRLVRGSAGLDLLRVKTKLALPTPIRLSVRMPLGARFELINAHDRRHLWLAEQVLEKLSR